jgi:tRNA threonylcarbamoyladenosine biosynthesis protein TsaB
LESLNENNEYILSLECSADTCGIAISNKGKLLGVVNYYKRNLHDKLLAELTRRILKDFELSYNELAAVAVSAGPGSFTGLRISAAFAKGLCFDGNIKLIAVQNTNAFAYSAKEYAQSLKLDEIVSVISSHKNVVYIQKFDLNAIPLNDIEIVESEQLSFMNFDNSLIVGSGAELIHHKNVDKEFIKPNVEYIMKLGTYLFDMKNYCDAEKYEPMYFQEFIPKQSTKTLNI